jgi:hypothetical protein
VLPARSLALDLAVLGVLAALPADQLMPEEQLRAEVARSVLPRPTTTEIDERLRTLDTRRRIAGLVGASGPRWQITDLGRLWRASAQ